MLRAHTFDGVFCSWNDHMFAAIVSGSSLFANQVLTWRLLHNLLVTRIE